MHKTIQFTRKPRVLVVDDDPLSRIFVLRKLKALADIAEANDGEEAMRDLESHSTDLVILDLEMPRLNGMQLIQLMRSKPSLRHIPIIVLTANERPEALAHSFMAGVTSVLCKPLDWRAFGEHVRHVLELAFRSSHLALHDQLTGLPNRVLFNDRLRHALEAADEHPVTVLAMDLDGFKQVNDTYGHAEGDALLVEVARRIRSVLPPSSTPARLGGDEFMVVGAMNGDDARHSAQRLIVALRAPYSLGGGIANIGVSIGIAQTGTPGLAPERLMANADRALYVAKTGCKGSFHVHAEESDPNARASTSGGEAQPVAQLTQQPVVSSTSGVVSSVKIAADAPGATPLSVLSLLQTTRVALSRDEVSRVRIGLDPIVLESPDFVDVVLSALAGSNHATERIEFSVSEASILAMRADHAPALRALVGAGCDIVLSSCRGEISMKRIADLPLAAVEFDGEIFARLADSGPSRALLGLVAATRALGLRLEATDVVSEEQTILLASLGIDAISGPYAAELAAPISADIDAAHVAKAG